MFRVFINNVEVSFAKKASKKPDCLNILAENPNAFQHIYDLCTLERGEKKVAFRVVSQNPKNTFKDFKASFENIRAAGGIVLNQKGEILMIFRLNTWDLPKGKIEKEEGKRMAALREVEEECGISELEIIKKLPKTYHMYPLRDRAIFKTTYWYEMRYNGNDAPTPQTEEAISQAQWCDLSFVCDVLKNQSTYKNIEILLKSYLKGI
ncbi:NUDIX domain-containing protein [Ornithobacterium rhinotracheale]|uniref:NUDIX hydrolase n=1 Tax=Ornithobacterium rhinotracheale TaxID=28251 RepID=UPI00129CAD20|nr:NUDIX domain-containing protein [Ornithobacterium rhinotracheale]MRJ09011.1 NUDIX domain-containing protein [Ornithobacterium rhinotracheale]UOH77182.1 NUDIX domain-containing protein [Ornithobacterium rhinotracheale]